MFEETATNSVEDMTNSDETVINSVEDMTNSDETVINSVEDMTNSDENMIDNNKEMLKDSETENKFICWPKRSNQMNGKSRKQYKEEQVQKIIEPIKKGYPLEIVEKISGLNHVQFNKYFVIVSKEYPEVIKNWNPSCEIASLKLFPDSVKKGLLSAHNNDDVNDDLYVKIESENGVVMLSLYEIDSNE